MNETRSEAFVNFVCDPPDIWEGFHAYTGRLAFDVGANGGQVSTMLAPNFDTVVAFEPCEESYVHLLRTAPANVKPQRLALSDHVGEVTLLETERTTPNFGELVTGDSMHTIWGEETGRRRLACSTLDAMVGAYGIPDFVKIDTEGHELLVVLGGWELFEEHRPMLVIEVHSEANGEAILALLDDRQFRRIDHPAYRPNTYYRRNHYYLVGL